MLWEAVGAVVGAGFASGQKIAVFFSRFGPWSWLAIAATLITVWLMTCRVFALGRGFGQSKGWRGALALLAIVCGGAMTAAAGEIAALTLPIHGARIMGMAGAMGFSWRCAVKESRLFRLLCQGMTAVLLGMMIACLFLPAQRGTVLPGLTGAGAAVSAAVYGVSYAGFNLALAAPLLASRSPSAVDGRRVTFVFTAVLGLLLCVGNAALLSHPMEMHAALPLVRLTARFGKAGYALCCLTLLLAEISTLAASLRTTADILPQRGRWAGPAAMGIIACMGFGEIASTLYPALGALCTVLLILPNNKALHPSKNMI